MLEIKRRIIKKFLRRRQTQVWNFAVESYRVLAKNRLYQESPEFKGFPKEYTTKRSNARKKYQKSAVALAILAHSSSRPRPVSAENAMISAPSNVFRITFSDLASSFAESLSAFVAATTKGL